MKEYFIQLSKEITFIFTLSTIFWGLFFSLFKPNFMMSLNFGILCGLSMSFGWVLGEFINVKRGTYKGYTF